MNEEEFLFRFNFNQYGNSCHNYKHYAPLKSAAVLIALVDGNDTDESSGLQVLLTKRSSHLKHHPSQISFPGGKVELSDKNLIHTALREAEEEVGLNPKEVDVIGQLPSYEIITGYQVTPIVAMIKSIQTYQKDNNEVDEIFHVPLQYFLQDKNHSMIKCYRNGQFHDVHFYPYKHHNIWGATAAIIKDLVNRIK